MGIASFDLFDRLMGGRLERRLRSLADEGHTYVRMAERLRSDNDIDVSHETVRRWCLDLGIENPRSRNKEAAS